MKSAFTLSILIIVFSSIAFGQKSANRMINVPDSIILRLAHFLQKTEKLDTLYKAIYVYRITESKNNKFTNDVYQFRLMGPHFRMRVFINHNGQLKIFENMYTEGVLKEYHDYILSTNLSEKIKIKYLNAIAIFLKENYEEQ